MKKFVYNYCIGLALVSLIMGCKGVESASAGGGGLVQMFIKGKDSLLYHAGPILYHSPQGGERLEMDYTYLKVKNQRNNVVCNFSVFTDDPLFKPTQMSVQFQSKNIEIISLSKFFAEGFGNKKYHYRYSFVISDVDFQSWMLDESPLIEVGAKRFEVRRAFRKKAEQVNRMILFDAF